MNAWAMLTLSRTWAFSDTAEPLSGNRPDQVTAPILMLSALENLTLLVASASFGTAISITLDKLASFIPPEQNQCHDAGAQEIDGGGQGG